jgi:SAM-dependent methyltransferase
MSDISRWLSVLAMRPGRKLDIDAEGIARDPAFYGAAAQEPELKVREEVASSFVRSPALAMREALRYHSRVVMGRRAHQVLLELENRGPGQDRLLVDLGAGFGWHWVELAARFRSVQFLLVDFALSSLRVCRALMPFDAYPNVLCLHADIADLPLADRQTDYCWSVQACQHLPPEKRLRCFGEIKRILKGQGGFYLGWLRAVPAIRLVYKLLGKTYHVKGRTAGGTYLQRYDAEVARELEQLFPATSLTYSETLFHPDLLWAPSGSLIGTVDSWLGSTRLAPLLARQAEIWGAAGC